MAREVSKKLIRSARLSGLYATVLHATSTPATEAARATGIPERQLWCFAQKGRGLSEGQQKDLAAWLCKVAPAIVEGLTSVEP